MPDIINYLNDTYAFWWSGFCALGHWVNGSLDVCLRDYEEKQVAARQVELERALCLL